MATSTVVNNSFDTQQPKATQPGLVAGAIGGGQQGQAANASMAAPAAPQSYSPVLNQVDRATQTASGQVESLLAKDSPLMQRARTLALQNMNQRGLVNSSMAQGAGVAAMIDKITPIAQQDAEAYANQALANQNAQNSAGQFNAGEANKFGLQRNDQTFTAGENLANREFQTSERLASQAFTAEQNIATQNFQSAQSALDRALQVTLTDKSIAAAAALETARQNFQTAENALDRANQNALQESQQTFQRGENALDRTQQTSLQAAQQAFQSGENALDRTSQQSLQSAAQTFQANENEKNRAAEIMLADKNISAQSAIQQAQREFQRSENQLDRTQQLAIADKNIGAQLASQTSQQNFAASQAAADRAASAANVQTQINAQSALQTATQNFQAIQNQADRDNQKDIVNLQNNLNKANVSASFAATVATGALNTIIAIQADPNLDPDAKKGAVQNVVDASNATLQWGSSFYNTPLPAVNTPGQTGATTLTPAPAAATGNQGIVNNAIQQQPTPAAPTAPDLDEFGLDRNDPDYARKRDRQLLAQQVAYDAANQETGGG